MIKTSKLKIVSEINMATNDMNNHNSHTQVTGHKPQFTNDNKTHTRFLASYTTTGHKPIVCNRERRFDKGSLKQYLNKGGGSRTAQGKEAGGGGAARASDPTPGRERRRRCRL